MLLEWFCEVEMCVAYLCSVNTNFRKLSIFIPGLFGILTSRILSLLSDRTNIPVGEREERRVPDCDGDSFYLCKIQLWGCIMPFFGNWKPD